jgi:hypothetical protein
LSVLAQELTLTKMLKSNTGSGTAPAVGFQPPPSQGGCAESELVESHINVMRTGIRDDDGASMYAYHVASLARSKLAAEAAQNNHDLRRIVAHANILDSLIMQLSGSEPEDEYQQEQELETELDWGDADASDTSSDSSGSDEEDDYEEDEYLESENFDIISGVYRHYSILDSKLSAVAGVLEINEPSTSHGLDGLPLVEDKINGQNNILAGNGDESKDEADNFAHRRPRSLFPAMIRRLSSS